MSSSVIGFRVLLQTSQNLRLQKPDVGAEFNQEILHARFGPPGDVDPLHLPV